MSNITTSINGKQVVEHAAKIINLQSGFLEKLLCDGPTFSSGTACVYKCSFCYVENLMAKTPAVSALTASTGKAFQDLVIRRKDPVAMVVQQLTIAGKPKFTDPNDNRVIFASPLVDVAANMELVRETAEICIKILELTFWQIRLLSKSNLLPQVAKLIPDKYKDRVIYGVSTGTMDDTLAKAFEEGTALVSKRISSLHWLQDNGYRTFGMICPSLPHDDYKKFSEDAAKALRIDRCEHVWAEVLNVRGDSMTRTCNSLEAAGYFKEAEDIRRVSASPEAWEEYARQTFLGHVETIPADKLRFLQYVNETNIDWWRDYKTKGAILLGKIATSV